MKIQWVSLLVVAAFVAGFLLGSPGKGDGATAAAGATPRSIRDQPAGSHSRPAFRPDSTFPDRIAAADYDQRRKMLDGIAPENRLAHIDQLLGRSGPDGLDHELKSAISSLLKGAMADSPDETLDWVLTREHIGYRDHLFEEIIKEDDHQTWVAERFDDLLARFQSLENPHKPLKALIGTKRESDPVGAIRLSKDLLVDHDGRIDYPGLLQEKSVAHGWQSAFEFYKDCWMENSSISSWSWVGEFPADFDFDNFATAWRNHEAGLEMGEEGRFYLPPKPIWDAWTRQDPEAAFAFLESEATATFGFDDFFDGYREVAEPLALFDFSRQMMAAPDSHRDELAGELHGYLAESPVNTRDFIGWATQNGDRSLLTAVLGEISPYYSGSTALGRSLLQTLPAGQRLAVIREAHTRQISGNRTRYYLGESQLKAFTGILTELGHTETEVRQALAGE
jgi:hypothetical protein